MQLRIIVCPSCFSRKRRGHGLRRKYRPWPASAAPAARAARPYGRAKSRFMLMSTMPSGTMVEPACGRISRPIRAMRRGSLLLPVRKWSSVGCSVGFPRERGPRSSDPRNGSPAFPPPPARLASKSPVASRGRNKSTADPSIGSKIFARIPVPTDRDWWRLLPQWNGAGRRLPAGPGTFDRRRRPERSWRGRRSDMSLDWKSASADPDAELRPPRKFAATS